MTFRMTRPALASAVSAFALLIGAAAMPAAAEESGPCNHCGGPPVLPALPQAVTSSGSFDYYSPAQNQINGQATGSTAGAASYSGNGPGSTYSMWSTLSPLASVTGSVTEADGAHHATADFGLGYLVTLGAKDQAAFDALKTWMDNGNQVASLHGDYALSFTGQGQAQATVHTGFNIPNAVTDVFGSICASNGDACTSGAFDLGVNFVSASANFSNGGALDFVSSVFLSVHARAGASGLSQVAGTASAYVDPLITLDFTGSGLNANDYILILGDGAVANAAADTPTGGVPEPASWALMIAGFGLTGAALRRRRSALA